MLHNSRDSWGLVTRSLHWLMALMILVQVPLGFLMVNAYDAWLAGKGDTNLVMALSRAHNTNGFMVLILVTLRLSWRLGNPSPELPAGLLAWQRLTARATHALLYGLLFVFPLSGWSIISAYDGDFPIFFFGWDHVPRLVPRVPKGSPLDSDFFTEIHETCWVILGVVVSLHVIAALWHEYVKKDGVLTRMLRG